MIVVYWLYNGEEVSNKFYSKEAALRFMYGRKYKGYLVTGWSCDDKYDHYWLERRFK